MLLCVSRAGIGFSEFAREWHVAHQEGISMYILNIVHSLPSGPQELKNLIDHLIDNAPNSWDAGIIDRWQGQEWKYPAGPAVSLTCPVPGKTYDSPGLHINRITNSMVHPRNSSTRLHFYIIMGDEELWKVDKRGGDEGKPEAEMRVPGCLVA